MNKFRNVKTVMDGVTFSSKAEAARYSQLKLLERSGEIADLKLQPRFRLTVNGMKIADYVADFSYLDKRKKFASVIEDVKGVKTPVYRIKFKLMQAIHGITVVEIGGTK